MIDSYVSIPHRYAKNTGSTAYVVEYEDGFQFLIGTLKTGKQEIVFNSLSGFNSS